MKATQIRNEEVETTDVELPEGWTEINLGVVVESMKNGLYKPVTSYADAGTACLRMYNIEGGKIVWKAIKRMRLTQDEIKEYGLAPGDLLINRVNSRELVGKTAVVPEGLETCVYESKNIRVRLIPELVNSDFVNYRLLLSGQDYFNFNSQQVVGMASISQPQIADFPLPLAPRAEQGRIVSKLQTLLENIDRIRTRIVRLPDLLKAFRQAVLAAACSGKLTEDWRQVHDDTLDPLLDSIQQVNDNFKVADSISTLDWTIPDSWRWATLGGIAEVVGGITKGQKRRASEKLRSVPYLRVANVQRGFLDLDEIKYIEATEEEISNLRLMPGDVLFTEGGDRDKLGRGWIWHGEIAECIHQNHIFRARLYSERLQGKFVSWFANLVGQNYFIDEGKQTVNLASINLRKLRAFPVPVLPETEQEEIVRRVEALFKLAETIERRVAVARVKAERLSQSVLSKAFRGELVPTEAELARREGRNYESAGVLLARIKKEETVVNEKANGSARRSGGKQRSARASS